MTNEAVLLVLTLTRTLSRPKSRESIIVVADQLRKLGGMLRDIGMPDEVLEAVSEWRLEVAEMTAGAFGDEEWVLHDLWQCAADRVWELQNIYVDERKAAVTCAKATQAAATHAAATHAAATQAANAARQLTSISTEHTNFYRACHLHYDAISGDVDWLDDEEAYDKIVQAVKLFREAVSSTSLSEHVEEMMRAMRSQSLSNHYSSENMKVVYDQALLNPSDPIWAILCADIGENNHPEILLDANDDHWQWLLRLETHAIKVLQSLQHLRPTRIQPLLVDVFRAHAWCLLETNHVSEAMQEFKEAIYIQARVVKFGQGYDLNSLALSVGDCLGIQLDWQRSDDALGTLKGLVEIAESDSRIRSEILTAGLSAFRSHLKSYRDAAALSATRALVDSLRPLRISNHSDSVLSKAVITPVTISNVQREIGEFQAALDTSREALSCARSQISRPNVHW